jgi:Zn-dependent M28 family amino/carboxypeptidase
MEMERYGLKPAFGEGTFFQTVHLIRVRDARGRDRVALEGGEMPPEVEVLDTLADVNVGGILWGSNPNLAEEVVVVSAHLDHLGKRPPRPDTPAEAEGDSIYNGADDDASGVAGVLEVARSMAQDGPGERTVLFLAFTGEEMGILGSRWYVQHPVFPLDQTVADLNVEMLGRPGPAYQGAGVGWITGFERSTLGPMLVAAGLNVKPDPFPDRGLFFGSDNIAFAMEGVPAHTLSSSDLHEDYHTPDDEVDRIDFESMTTVVNTLIDAVRVLADGEAPHWVEGGRPEPRGGGE